MAPKRSPTALNSDQPKSPRREARTAAAAARVPPGSAGSRSASRPAGAASPPPPPTTPPPPPPPPPPGRSLTALLAPLNPKQPAAHKRMPPPPCLMSGGSGSSSVMTYASAVSGRANQSLSPEANLSGRLCFYLKENSTSSVSSETRASPPIITLGGPEPDGSNLKIIQEHLEEHDQELAHALFDCRDRCNAWLHASVCRFLTSEGIVKKTVTIKNSRFYTVPPSTKTLEDYLWEQGPFVSIKSIFRKRFKFYVADDTGIMLAHGFLAYILKSHAEGRTWKGIFSTSDMVVENHNKCRITKISVQGESHHMTDDLYTIGKIFKRMFSNDGDDGEKALYFDELIEDLTGAGTNEVKEEWRREYLLSHLALKSSITRYHLVCGLHHAVRTFGGEGTPIQSALGVQNDWQALIPAEITKNSSPGDLCLYKVFWFKSEHNGGVDVSFANTFEGLLEFKRHLLQHGQQYVKVKEHSELEQFAAKTFPKALPNILRMLLKDCKMHKSGALNEHWKAYRDSRVEIDGNTEGRTGICISFCEGSSLSGG